ncbi:MAG TPA: rhodanese-like domain-containing protein [Solirubrobacteraceae bacterium]
MSFASRCGSTPVTRRGMALAASAAAAALVPETLHGAEDVRAGLGPASALVVLLLVQVAAIAAAVAGRRWAVRLLLAVSVGWILGALVDHPQVFTDPAGFRAGWTSTAAVLALIALDATAATFALAPAMPARWDAVKTPPQDAWAAVDRQLAHVLDVRTARERASGAIPGAITASWRHPVVPDDDRRVLVVCAHGARSLRAVHTLRRRGIDAHSIAGGMSAYRRANLPVDGRA